MLIDFWIDSLRIAQVFFVVWEISRPHLYDLMLIRHLNDPARVNK